MPKRNTTSFGLGTALSLSSIPGNKSTSFAGFVVVTIAAAAAASGALVSSASAMFYLSLHPGGESQFLHDDDGPRATCWSLRSESAKDVTHRRACVCDPSRIKR